MLSVSGQLNPKPFGPPVPVMEDDVGQVVLGMENRDGAGYKKGDESLPAEERHRRSVYVQVRRSKPLAVLDTFDWATVEPNCEVRNSSTVTPQSLLLMNNDFVLDQAEAFAARLKKSAGSDPHLQVILAWKLAYGVAPNADSSVVVPRANSWRLVLPISTAPAWRSRAVTGASLAATSSRRTLEDAVVGTPA